MTTRGLPLRHTANTGEATGEGCPRGTGSRRPICSHWICNLAEGLHIVSGHRVWYLAEIVEVNAIFERNGYGNSIIETTELVAG
jgi:hypothetical protein